MTLNDRVAIVTGGAQGIGLGIARALASDGADVVVCSRTEPASSPGDRVAWQACDVTDKASVEALVADVVGDRGRLDILVNNAGIQVEKSVADSTDDDWDRVMGTNARGVFLMCRAAIPAMVAKEGDRGVIINIGSTSGHAADPSMALYNASKAFVHGLTRSIAVDHGAQGIRCNAICPGWIDTGMADDAFALADDPAAAKRDALARHASGRLGTPADIGALAAWLASDASGFVTGQMFIADGGLLAASPINPSLF